MVNGIIPYSKPEQQFKYFNFEGHEFRVLLCDGDTYFIANEACELAGLSNVSEALKALDADEKGEIRLPDLVGRRQAIRVVTESGLYHLIFKSRKPEAARLRRWVTEEVLPSIRKTGIYVSDQVSLGDLLVAQAEAFRALEQKLDRALSDQAEKNDAITARLDERDYHTVRQWCRSQNIKTTVAMCQQWGKKAAALSREKGVQIRKIETPDAPWAVENLYHVDILTQVCVPKPVVVRSQLPLLES